MSKRGQVTRCFRGEGAKGCVHAKGTRCPHSKTKEDYLAYHRNWRRLRAWVRRLDAIVHLGGRCAICGYASHLDALQIDHIVPARRRRGESKFNSSVWWVRSWSTILKMLEGCQLLCANCHSIKTRQEARTTGGWYV